MIGMSVWVSYLIITKEIRIMVTWEQIYLTEKKVTNPLG